MLVRNFVHIRRLVNNWRLFLSESRKELQNVLRFRRLEVQQLGQIIRGGRLRVANYLFQSSGYTHNIDLLAFVCVLQKCATLRVKQRSNKKSDNELDLYVCDWLTDMGNGANPPPLAPLQYLNSTVELGWTELAHVFFQSLNLIQMKTRERWNWANTHKYWTWESLHINTICINTIYTSTSNTIWPEQNRLIPAVVRYCVPTEVKIRGRVSSDPYCLRRQ